MQKTEVPQYYTSLLIGLFISKLVYTYWTTHFLQWMPLWGAICLMSASVTSCRAQPGCWSHTNCITFRQWTALSSLIMLVSDIVQDLYLYL